MAHSYDRWKPIRPLSWPCKLYLKHKEEHKQMYWSFRCSSKYTFKILGKTGARRTDLAQNHFEVKDNEVTIQDWQDSYHKFSNWTNLNQVLAQAACLETYIASILRLAFDSDPGIIAEASHHIDGVRQLKFGNSIDKQIIEFYITNCTKGTWQSRINSINNLFGYTFNSFADNCGDLENLREIRNNVGHAFGRPISQSHNYGSPIVKPMIKVSEKKVIKYFKIITDCVVELDKYVMQNHIGNFQEFHYLHNCIIDADPLAPPITGNILLSRLNQHARETYSLQFSNWLLNYYNSL